MTLNDGRLQLRAAAYFIEWQGMPVVLTADCGFLVGVNAGKSESKGLEVEGTALLGESWTVDFGFSYTNVELAEDAPSLGNKGDPLPGTPEYLLSLGAEYRFQLLGRDAFARVNWTYVDDYYNNIAHAFRLHGADLGRLVRMAGLARAARRRTLDRRCDRRRRRGLHRQARSRRAGPVRRPSAGVRLCGGLRRTLGRTGLVQAFSDRRGAAVHPRCC